MKLGRFLTLSFVSMVCATAVADSDTFEFRPDSRLSEGKWVKVEIDRTGLYSISYDRLREMGFENPSQVGVFGRGGELLSTDFDSADNCEPYSDDIAPVAVIHENNSLYFYGKNTERVTFTPGSAPWFNRGLGNLYSTTAYYFLSDSEEPLIAEVYQPSSDAEELTSGWDYIYHELDLQQNTSGTGQVFWGENFLDGSPEKSWNLQLPYNAGGTARVGFRFYTSADTGGSTAFVKLGASNPEKSYKCNTSSSSESFYAVPSAVASSPAVFEIDEKESQLLSLRMELRDPDFHNLDFWIVTYMKKIPSGASLDSNPAERYTFVTTEGDEYSIPLNSSLRLLDISNPSSIKLGGVDVAHAGRVSFTASGNSASVIIYDPAEKQLEIKGWEPVANNNLHALQQQSVDMLIVTTPKFRQYAERLAGLHKTHQGMAVAVATPEEIYNEFSAGVPDPMAYRAISKMLYQADPDKYKNMLLFGPSDRNLRQEIEGETKFDRILAYQQISVTPERAASPAYDFYGIVSNHVNEVNLYNEDMKIGVGLLSCETDTDCERILRKIENYLADDTQAWLVNETMTIGGTEDNHAHDGQAEKFGNEIRNFNGLSGMSHSTVAVDAYGNEGARNQMIRNLENGKIFNVYFGHGSSSMFGRDKKFFTTAEAVNLRNSHCGFLFMGGCDFSVPDVRSRGLGETLLLDTDHGMIGTIVSTRTAWSNQNYSLAVRFLQAWLNTSLTETSPTIGEIYAKVKSGKSGLGSNVMNSLTFVLAGDPALKVPTPIRRVAVNAPESVAPGQKVRIEGDVMYKATATTAASPDPKFNGKVVLKLMQPLKVLRSKDYVTNTCNTEKNDSGQYITLDVTYDTNLMTAVESEVKDGKFSAEIMIPADASDFAGDTLKLNVGVFDKSRWLGGAGAATFIVSDTSELEVETDMEAPVLDMAYDATRQAVVITASDDNAILLSAANHDAMLDGKPFALSDELLHQAGETGMHLQVYADVFDLQDGKHNLMVTISDVAGNKVSSDLEFVKTPVKAPLSLTLSKKAVTDGLDIEVEGEFSGALDYEIADTDGNVVMKSTAASSSMNWNCLDNKGNRVKEGLYRVRVRSASGASRTLYSDWANFAVFD